ncbi:hypothetical protein GW915_02355 [bacterium]|nr:hypothetical protein [bacterium]
MAIYGWTFLGLAILASCSSKKPLVTEGSEISIVEPSLKNSQPLYFESDTVVSKATVEKNHYIYERMNPDDFHQSLVLFLSAQGLIARGDLKKAEGAVELLLKAFPKVAATFVLASDLRRAQGESSQAKEFMKQASLLAPSDIAVKRSLAAMEGVK